MLFRDRRIHLCFGDNTLQWERYSIRSQYIILANWFYIRKIIFCCYLFHQPGLISIHLVCHWSHTLITYESYNVHNYFVMIFLILLYLFYYVIRLINKKLIRWDIFFEFKSSQFLSIYQYWHRQFLVFYIWLALALIRGFGFNILTHFSR